MFSEHKKSEKSKTGKDLTFDSLDDKTKKLSLSPKETRSEEVDKRTKSIKKEQQKPSSSSLNLVKTKEKGKESSKGERSSSMEGGAAVETMGYGIFEAASMMCNIVDITTDSTNRKLAGGSQNKKLKSNGSKGSLSSQFSQSGPFAMMKEAVDKKQKRSVDQHDGDDDNNDS